MRDLKVLRNLGAALVLLVSLDAASAAAPAKNQDVEPEALAALDRMGAYLRTLQSFEIKAVTTTDVVLDDGQKVQFAGTNTYKVRRPNGFVISVANDRKVRQFYYDGKSLTVFSPRMGYYATVAAAPTIRETLDAAYKKFDIELPLADLFRWGSSEDRHDDLTSGFVVGYANINGVDADHYAFREGGVDWQIWIRRGDKPVPLKAVITTNDDPAKPEYAALLSWNTAATFGGDTFRFKPPKDAKPIAIMTAGR